MADKHHEEIHVTETTPQGTQEQGVEGGHEDRDINIRAVMVWFRSLAIMAVLSILAMWGMFAALSKIQEGKDVMPSPLFEERNQPTMPEPRLLPEPWEAMAQETLKENKKIQKHGLADEKGDPTLPDNAVGMVTEAQGGGAAGGQGTAGSQGVVGSPGTVGTDVVSPTMSAMPSDASGGTVMEQRQQ